MMDGPNAAKWRFEVSFFVEVGLLLIFLGVFIFMWVESLDWPFGAALFPRIAAATGVLSVLAFIAQRIHQARNPRRDRATRILDLQWSTGDTDAVTLKRRIAVIAGSIAALWLGVWLIGFHAAVPLYLFSQLILLGNTRWWSAALVALGALAIIVGVYDQLLQVSWNKPVIQEIWQDLASR